MSPTDTITYCPNCCKTTLVSYAGGTGCVPYSCDCMKIMCMGISYATKPKQIIKKKENFKSSLFFSKYKPDIKFKRKK